MNERKKLKKQLRDKYIFRRYLSTQEVRKILSENPKDKHEKLFASLTVGCVKINAIITGNIFIIENKPSNEPSPSTCFIK